MAAAAAGIGFELGGHIAGIAPGKARRARAIAASVDPMAGDAGIGRARVAAAERDHFATGDEMVSRATLHRTAARQHEPGHERQWE